MPRGVAVSAAARSKNFRDLAGALSGCAGETAFVRGAATKVMDEAGLDDIPLMSSPIDSNPNSRFQAEDNVSPKRPEKSAKPAAKTSALDRQRGPGKRRTEYRRDAEEGHMNEEQLEFIKAIDEYKRANQKPFPTWTEVLDLVLYLGYRKVAPIGEFALIKSKQGDADARDDDE